MDINITTYSNAKRQVAVKLMYGHLSVKELGKQYLQANTLARALEASSMPDKTTQALINILNEKQQDLILRMEQKLLELEEKSERK